MKLKRIKNNYFIAFKYLYTLYEKRIRFGGDWKYVGSLYLKYYYLDKKRNERINRRNQRIRAQNEKIFSINLLKPIR